MKLRLPPRVALLIIAAMFILPLAVAWMMYSGTIEFKPGSTRNLGTLVKPPVPVDWKNDLLITVANDRPGLAEPGGAIADLFNEHWVILHALPEPCSSTCLDAVTSLRQVHRASGRHQGRIRIALLLPDSSQPETISSLGEIYGLFHLIRDPDGEMWETLRRISRSTENRTENSGDSYLIDPLGNIMMLYVAGSDPNHLKKDLKRLLTWSKLDEQ